MVPNFFGCPGSTPSCGAGEWLIVTPLRQLGEVYGKVQEGESQRTRHSPKLMHIQLPLPQLMGRDISVGVDTLTNAVLAPAAQ